MKIKMSMSIPLPHAVGEAAAVIAEQVLESVVEVRSPRGGAAGIVWHPGGVIVTNHHVAPRDGSQVELRDGRRFDAQVFARDPLNDLAALRVPATGLPAASIGDARALKVGELMLALGHAFGIRGALSAGIVSAVLDPEDGTQERELIRADVLLGPGNSGGPLADAAGRVVGINSMVFGGLALAVPSYLAERLLHQTAGPSLGVGLREVELAPALAARTASAKGRAALIVRINPKSPAERAGLLPGDLVTGLNGRSFEQVDRFAGELRAVGEAQLTLSVIRGGQLREVPVQLSPERKAA